MRKWIFVFILFAFSLILFACGGSGNTNGDKVEFYQGK